MMLEMMLETPRKMYAARNMQFVRKEKPCYLKQKRYRGQLNALVNSKNLYRCSLDYGYVELCNVVGGFRGSAAQGKEESRKDYVG